MIDDRDGGRKKKKIFVECEPEAPGACHSVYQNIYLN